MHVQGCTLGVVPYIKSVNINTKEYCEDHVMVSISEYFFVKIARKLAKVSVSKWLIYEELHRSIFLDVNQN